MQQLINQISTEFELTQEEATKIVNLVKNYQPTNEANDNTEDSKEDVATENDEQGPALHENEVHASVAPVAAEEEGTFAKATHFVEDHLPGGMKEKAEELLGSFGDKVKGLFGSK